MEIFWIYLEKFYRQKYDGLFRIAKTLLGDVYLAEDAVEETVLRIISHYRWWMKLSEPNRLMYAQNICRNVCEEFLKKKNKYLWLEFDEEMGEGYIEKELERLFELEVLRYGLGFLHKEDRKIVFEKYYLGWNNKKIARMHNTTENNISKRLQRGRELIRKIIKK